MKLRYIAIWADYQFDDKLEKKIRVQFDDNTRFICNYLSKAVRKLKIETDSYTMLGIVLHPTTGGIHVNEIDKCLIVHLCYTIDDYKVLYGLTNLTSRYEYYLSLLQRGYEMAVAGGHEEICIVKLLQLHEQFRALGYKNEWLWKKRQLKDKGLYIYFKCYFTTFDFQLELEAYTLKTKELLVKETVFQTPPDEICYAKDLRKVLYEQDKIVILDFCDYPMFEIDLPKLCQGECHVTYLDEGLKRRIQKYPKEIAGITW